MIPRGVEIFIAVEPINLHFSFDRLSDIVSERLGRPPRCGALFIFFGRRRSAMKIFFCDGSGLCVFYKRLDRSTFRMPEFEPGATSVEIDERLLDDLLDGIQVETKVKPTRPRPVH